jgi:hypothetical protein
MGEGNQRHNARHQAGLRLYLWPRDFGLQAAIVSLSELVIGLVALIAAVLSAVGLIGLSTSRFEQIVVGIAGLVLVALTVEAGERRRLLREQEEVQVALRLITAQADVREVPSDEIHQGITELLGQAHTWIYRGGSARFLRSETLPTLARVTDTTVEVLVQLLDPRHGNLCREYARYRDVQRAATVRRAGEGELRTIQTDLLATIYAAAWYTLRTRIRAEVVLLRAFSPLRYDMGSNGLFVTVADLSQPGLYARSSSWYYRSMSDEARQASHGHPSLVMPTADDGFPRSKADVDHEAVHAGLAAIVVRDPQGDESSLLAGDASPNVLDFPEIAATVFPASWQA